MSARQHTMRRVYLEGRRDERDRWIRAAYVVLRCNHCRSILIAGEPACPMCEPVRLLAEPERFP